MQLGALHPDHLREKLSSSQIQGWMAYEAIEPFGEYRSELRNGSLMALLANLKRNPEVKHEPWAAIDFMHFTEVPPERELTDEELEAYAAQVFGA